VLFHKYDILDIDASKYSDYADFVSQLNSCIQKTSKRNYDEVYSEIKIMQKKCDLIKQAAIRNNDENTANISFLLNEYLVLLQSIARFWQSCDSLDYPSAWSFLQDGLDSARVLGKFLSEPNTHHILDLKAYLQNFEKFFPYAYFCSIEAVVKKKECSICKRSPFDPACNHIAGNLYYGEMAVNVVTDMEFVAAALVRNPDDKRCIIEIKCDKQNIQSGPFKLIHQTTKSLVVPYLLFEIILTKRRMSRSFYGNWPSDSPCPCGSDKKFKECCSDKEEIENPHYLIKASKQLALVQM